MKIGIETKAAAARDLALKTQMKTAGFIECFILGIGIAAGGIATSRWHTVLLGGIWEGLIATLISMVGYYMLDLSLAELVGIVPFAGGSFGFVRCSLGPFWGFMAACVEMCVYMFYSIRTNQKIAQLITEIAATSHHLEPLWALCAFVCVASFHLRGGICFWFTMISCTVFTFLLLALHIGASLSIVDFDAYALGHNSKANDGFLGNGDTYMEVCYLPMWFYMGICALPLAGQRVKDAHIHIPRAMMAAMTVMAAISITMLFYIASQAPGVGEQLNQVTFVLENALQSVCEVPRRYVAVLLVIPTYASATGFMFACKHQLSAMAESGLMPSIFKNRFGPNNIPIYAVLLCSFVQFVLYLVIDHYETEVTMTYRLCCVSACLMYIAVLSAFIAFRYQFEGMKRHFVSPVGIYGAALGIVIFLQLLLSLLFFQHDNHAGPVSLLVFLCVMVVYYFGYVQYTQFFSREEQDKFMKAYILNANKKRQTNQWLKVMNALFIQTGLIQFVSSHRSRFSAASNVAPSRAGSAVHRNESLIGGSVASKSNKVGVEPVSLQIEAGVGPFERKDDLQQKQSLAWSGKHFEGDEMSRKAFQMLNLNVRQGLSKPGSPRHGVSKPNSPHHGLSQANSLYHGLSRPNSLYRGLSLPSSPRRGRSQPASPHHGLSQSGTPRRGEVVSHVNELQESSAFEESDQVMDAAQLLLQEFPDHFVPVHGSNTDTLLFDVNKFDNNIQVSSSNADARALGVSVPASEAVQEHADVEKGVQSPKWAPTAMKIVI